MILKFILWEPNANAPWGLLLPVDNGGLWVVLLTFVREKAPEEFTTTLTFSLTSPAVNFPLPS